MKRSFQVPRKRPAAEVEGANGCYSKPASKPKIAPAAQVPPAQGRMPLTSVQTAAGWSAPSEPVIDKTEQGFQALYTASSQKRRNNKTWLDGFILFQGSSAPYTLQLYSSEGKLVTKTAYKTEIATEDLFQLRGWDIEVCDPVSPASIHNGSCYIDTAASTAPPAPCLPAAMKATRSGPPSRPPTRKPQAFNLEEALILDQRGDDAAPVYVPGFLARKLRPHQQQGVQFLYNVRLHYRSSNRAYSRTCDGYLCSTPECVGFVQAVSGKDVVSLDNSDPDGNAGFSNDNSQPAHYGAILADDMGLGKTLQVLATSWALMNAQGPTGRPLVRKMLIVAPSSVISNWGKEIKKWIGAFQGECHRVLLPGKSATNLVNGFKAGVQWKFLIASYETIRKFSSDLKGTIDLLICDEGHRLKSKNLNSTMKALLEIGCPRRIILTGTPCQNNLLEFYSMMSFVNPGLLGPPAVFQRVFVKPIEASQDTSATPEDIESGEARSKELQRRISSFMLRRTSAVNEKYLPKCFQYVVFCRPTATQLAAYKKELYGEEDCSRGGEQSALRKLLVGSGVDGSRVLSLINRMRQICNHAQFAQVSTAPEPGPISFTPQERGLSTARGSTKLNVLRCMLKTATALGEKVVIVSTSTQMLDAAAQVCGGLSLPTGRIDGSTAAALRQERVDQFNDTSPVTGELMKVFLLSTRAGGAGLNLIGGSRLILLDSDWNPAMDQQAMARIWRDGQKLPCHIYRLLVTGLIDEKIFQRQLYKGNLSGVVGNGSKEAGSSTSCKKSNSAGSFSRDELRKLFSINENTDCDTQATMATGDAGSKVAWNDVKESTDDAVLQAAVQGASVSYAWLQAVKGQSVGDDEDQALEACTDNLAPCVRSSMPVEQPLAAFSDDEDDVGQENGATAAPSLSDDEFEIELSGGGMGLEDEDGEGGDDIDDADNARAVDVLDDDDDTGTCSSEEGMKALSSAVQKVDNDRWDDVELDSPLR